MITYNPKSWFGLIFQFHKTDTFRILAPAMMALAVYTGTVCFFFFDVVHSQIRGTTIVHSLLGFVISLLLVFRTNTAYDRWWEGRRLWGGLLNTSRSLSIKIESFIEDSALKTELLELIALFPFYAKEHLRKGINKQMRAELHTNADITHYPNHITLKIQKCMSKGVSQKIITPEVVLITNEEIKYLSDFIGGCERIKNTPIPYSYSLFLKKFIFVYVVTMPFAFISDFGYWSILVVVFTFYVLASLELIAEEIEDPFGSDANDLPTDEIAEKIKLNIAEITRNAKS